LLKLAKEAVAAGEVSKVLDALDKRVGTKPDEGPTFSQFADDWYKTCVKDSDLRESQQLSDEQIVRLHLKPFFGRQHVGEIDGRLIDRYKAEKRTEKHHRGVGYSPASMNNHLSVLHRIFEKAIEYRLIEKNPIHKSAWMSSNRTPEDMENWWTPADEEKAFTFLHQHWREKHPRRYMPLLLQLVVGMRFSELRALEKRDLDFNTPGLWIRRAQARKKVSTPKNKHARFHVIPRALAEELKTWMLRTEGQLLFPALHGGADCEQRPQPLVRRAVRRRGRPEDHLTRRAAHFRVELRCHGRRPEDDRPPARPQRHRRDRAIHARPGRRHDGDGGGAVGELAAPPTK
jgi:integrase